MWMKGAEKLSTVCIGLKMTVKEDRRRKNTELGNVRDEKHGKRLLTHRAGIILECKSVARCKTAKSKTLQRTS